jgi:hypothetical protein
METTIGMTQRQKENENNWRKEKINTELYLSFLRDWAS